MTRNHLIAGAFAVLAVVATVVFASLPELPFARLLGKAAWYVPYAALVGAVRFLKVGA